VIRFRDSKSRPTPPPWLVGASDLVQRVSRDGTLWGAGDALTLDAGGIWHDIGDGIAVAGPTDAHDAYQKRQAWFTTEAVEDLSGRTWEIPRIVDANGERAFRVAYGPDFLPALTAEQYAMIEIAKAARDGVIASQTGVQDVDMPTACRWAAALLCCSYHLNAASVGCLHILDDALVVGAIQAACGVTTERVVA
jgi:hypothetical protein